MPSDQLGPGATAPRPQTVRTERVRQAAIIESAVLEGLTGAPAEHVAMRAGLTTDELAEATAVYRAAGQRALHDSLNDSWWHLYIEFPDWHTADQVATQHLAPLFTAAEDAGLLSTWWFLRKHPCWRVRLRPGRATMSEMRSRLAVELDRLTSEGTISTWRQGIYEAEVAAFGGVAAMEAVHTLFWRDSQAVLRTRADDRMVLGRRETSVLLCSTMLHAARLERYEQGDVWRRVAHERPLPPEADSAQLATIAADLQTLLQADTTSDGPLFGKSGIVSTLAPWADAFRQVGEALGSASREGSLERGLRETLSYVVLFVWNRHGLPTSTQSALARAAGDAVLGAKLS